MNIFLTWSIGIKSCASKMALAEQQCYTIINTPELSDVYNEMKIKKDLGKFVSEMVLNQFSLAVRWLQNPV